MAKLIYSALTSLDLFVADQSGNFDWAAPDEEVHQFVNDLMRPMGTHLYGRRMYEVLVAWESPDIAVGEPPVVADFAAIWRGADKIVYSRSLESVASARTTIERDFDPEAIRAMKASADGLVDEIHLVLNPILVGAGNPALPDDIRVPLELLDERRFGNGAVHLGYRVVV